MKVLFQIICEAKCNVNPLTTMEWYVVFICCATIVAQLPNLNSIAGISLIGAITAISYSTLIWVVSISKNRPVGVSYDPVPHAKSHAERVFDIFNALGIIAFAFRGHNLILEIQVFSLYILCISNPCFVLYQQFNKLMCLILEQCYV